MAARPWTATAGGLLLVVRLTPRGGRDAIEGIEELADGRAVLKVRVRATPSEGEANAALARLIARTLGVAARDVALTGGGAGENLRDRLVSRFRSSHHSAAHSFANFGIEGH